MSINQMGTSKSALNLEEMVVYYQKQLREDALYYLGKRGIEQETIEMFRIGFDPGKIGFYVSPHQWGDYFENRIIIPLTNAQEVTVDLIGRSIDHREPKYKSLTGEDFMFNEEILEDTEDVILCNGVFDVLSLAQARLPGVSVPYWLGFKETHVELLKDKRVFICMGNDELGRRESVRIQTLLQQAAKETYIVHLPETIRDVNDFFVRAQNPLETFIEMLNQTMEDTMMVPVAPDSNHITIYTEEYMKRYRGQVSGTLSGIAKLDEALFGGFGCGLYLLTGAASIGKSMLMKQMADHIALDGTPVIYVSWDMTGFELWARSIARILGVEPQLVMSGKIDPDQIGTANAQYIPISKMLWTLECSMETTLEKVIASIGKIAMVVGKMPVVFIDHLQRVPIVGGKSLAATAAERNTMITYALKQWSKEANVTVIAAMPVGDNIPICIPEGVEASADVIMLLNPQGLSANGEEQHIALQLLKNRNGSLVQIPLVFQHQKAFFSQ